MSVSAIRFLDSATRPNAGRVWFTVIIDGNKTRLRLVQIQRSRVGREFHRQCTLQATRFLDASLQHADLGVGRFPTEEEFKGVFA
jgi:hypothetical protein